MKRTEALVLWRRIAAGDLQREQDDPIDLLKWIEGVAAAVIEADKQAKSSQQRVNDLAKAIGLAGRVNERAELQRLLKIWLEFDPIPAGTKPRDRDEAIVKVARAFSPGLKNVDSADVLRRANRLLHKP